MKKTLRTLLLAALMVLTLCATALAEDTNTGALTLTTKNGMLYGSFTVPEGYEVYGDYSPVFYHSANGVGSSHSWSSYYPANYDMDLFFINDTSVDRFALYKSSDGYEFANLTPIYDIALEKPISSVKRAFDFPGTDVTVTVTENPNSSRENNKYIYTFSGLDCDNYAYVLRNAEGGSVIMSGPRFAQGDRFLGELTMTAYRTRETEEWHLIESSETYTLTASYVDGSGDDDQAGQSGYGVGLEVWNNIFFVNPIVPEGTDEEQMYDICLYSSETGNSFGNTQFSLGGGVVVPDVAGTYDRAKLWKSGTQKVLADVELEKPVIASFTLEVPAGVTVSRTEINATTDQYTVKGIDLNKYGYELSPDGYGGKNLSEETFTIGKDYYGDMTTAYVQIFSAVEKDDAYYLDRSPYATVTVNEGESGGEEGIHKLAAPTDLEWGKLYDGNGTAYDYTGMIGWTVTDTGYNQEFSVKVYHESNSQEPVFTNAWIYRAGGDAKWNDHDFGNQFPGDFPNGDYYFTIQAVGDGETTADSDVVTSPVWTYTRPEKQLAAPTNLVWNWPANTWDAVLGENAGAYVVEYYYSATNANATSRAECDKRLGGYMWFFDMVGSDNHHKIPESRIGDPGYYYFSVAVRSKDINAASSSEIVFSKAYAYGVSQEEKPTVSGTVTNGGGASIEINGQSVQVNEDGSFEIPAEGTFNVAIKKGGCLTYTIKGVTTENGNVELPEVVLVAGDVNEDGKINIQDMGTFRAEFGKTGDAIGNDYTDVNEDGKVNIQDMGTFRANFGKTAEKDCTVEYGA